MKAKKDKIGGFIIEKISQTKTVYQGNGPKDKIEKFQEEYVIHHDADGQPEYDPCEHNSNFI